MKDSKKQKKQKEADSYTMSLFNEVKQSLNFLHYRLAAFAQLHASAALDVNCYALITGLLPSMLRDMSPLYLTFISGEVLLLTRYYQPYNISFFVNLNSNCIL